MNKILPIMIVALLVVGGGSFYGGMKYGVSKKSVVSSQARMAQFGQGGQVGSRNGRVAGMGGTRQLGTGGGFVGGEVISKDDKSITVKLRDGGSKIIFLSASTTISRFAEGAVSDISVGTEVTVNGQAGQDGSIVAESIQIRPSTPQVPAQK